MFRAAINYWTSRLSTSSNSSTDSETEDENDQNFRQRGPTNSNKLLVKKSKYRLSLNFVKMIGSPPPPSSPPQIERFSLLSSPTPVMMEEDPNRQIFTNIFASFGPNDKSQFVLKDPTLLLTDLEGLYLIEKLDNWNHQFSATSNSDDPKIIIHTLIESFESCGKGHLFKLDYERFKFEFGHDSNLTIEGRGRRHRRIFDAVDKTLEFFKQVCSTIQQNDSIPSTLTVNRNEMISSSGSNAIKIPVAMNLLLKMGWKGGGLGVNEDGISEPVQANPNAGFRGRAGLGCAPIKNVRPFRETLGRYLKGEERRLGIFSIKFAEDFTPAEHKIIRQTAAFDDTYSCIEDQLDDNGILLLVRKIGWDRLVKEVKYGRGANVKYRVIPSNINLNGGKN